MTTLDLPDLPASATPESGVDDALDREIAVLQQQGVCAVCSLLMLPRARACTLDAHAALFFRPHRA
jgi:hypothetical protein